MFSNPLIRLSAALIPAAIITYGLFLTMHFLISQDYKKPDPSEEYSLEAITPQAEETQVRSKARAKPRRKNAADKPPPPPKFSANKSDIDLPTPTIQGAAPSRVPPTQLSSLSIDPVAISDRDAQPIRPPVPTYPNRALERGKEGTCEVKFNVDVKGKPYDVRATCTDNIFKREAERAVSRSEFAPKIVRGRPAEYKNVIYPLEFSIAE